MTREEAIDVYNGLINTKIKEAFEFFAPELRKINEEEIRKDIIGGLMWQRDNLKSEGPHDNNLILPGFCLTVGEHLKYLEKQKEPKHAPDDLQKSFEAGQASIVDNPEQYGLCKKPELVQQPPITYTYNSNASRDERLKAALLALLNSDLIKVREGGYFTKQDLIEWVERIPTEKPAWSEEDEAMRNNILSVLSCFVGTSECESNPSLSTSYPLYQREKDWLKSLRPCHSWKPSEQEKGSLRTAISILTEERNFPKAAAHLQAILDAFDGKESRKDWKPSEEQMEALNYAIAEWDGGKRLEGLYALRTDLKKLI